MLVLQRTRPVVKSMPMSAVFSLLLSQVVGACSFFAANALLRAQFVAWTSEEDTQKTLAPELSALSGGTCFTPRRPAALLVPRVRPHYFCYSGLAATIQWTAAMPVSAINCCANKCQKVVTTFCVCVPLVLFYDQFDTVKTKMQTTPKGEFATVREVCRHMWAVSGRTATGFITALYSGWGPAVGRAFVGIGACFLGIEACGKALRLLDP